MDEMKTLLQLDAVRTAAFDFMTGLGDNDPRWDEAIEASKKAEEAFKAQWDLMGMTSERWLTVALQDYPGEVVELHLKEVVEY